MERNRMPKKPTLGEATRFWLKLGFISFGGPAGQIAIMHEYLVAKKKWISDSRFLHALNYCMVLPGPEAQQLATYLGWLLHGTRGGLIAGLLFILPSLLILLGLSIVYVTFGKIPWVESIFEGLKPAVIAIVVVALIKIGKKSLLSYFHYGVAIIAFALIFFLNIPFPLIILGAVIVSLVFQKLGWIVKAGSEKPKSIDEELEKSYFINEFSPRKKSESPWKTASVKFAVGIFLWIIPFVLFLGISDHFQFWKTISLFFTQAALVTFGGAYAVLPYVAQVSVEKYHWLDSFQMLDGLALGETTPGPLIMVLVFVGFMAGYNSFEHSILMGTLGLLTTTYFTFLPCFLFVLAGAPWIELTRENKQLKSLLAIVTAAVVGVVLNLTIYLGKGVFFPTELAGKPNYLAIAWTVVSFFALYRFKINMLAWIGVSAIFGMVTYLISN